MPFASGTDPVAAPDLQFSGAVAAAAAPETQFGADQPAAPQLFAAAAPDMFGGAAAVPSFEATAAPTAEVSGFAPAGSAVATPSLAAAEPFGLGGSAVGDMSIPQYPPNAPAAIPPAPAETLDSLAAVEDMPPPPPPPPEQDDFFSSMVFKNDL